MKKPNPFAVKAVKTAKPANVKGAKPVLPPAPFGGKGKPMMKKGGKVC